MLPDPGQVPYGGKVGFNYCFCRPVWGGLLHKSTVISMVLRGDQLQMILPTLEGQRLYLLSSCSLINVPNETDDCDVVCKLEEFHKRVH